MPAYVELDFETRSLCDLKVAGAERYSEDVTTEVICLCWEYDNEVGVWAPVLPWSGSSADLRALAANPDVIFVAHNAGFEQAIWRNQMVMFHDFPAIPIERWDCSMAMCAVKSLPLALDRAGRALRLNSEKDKEGNKLTLAMSKTDKKTHNTLWPGPEWGTKKDWTKSYRPGMLPTITPAIRQRIIDYCQQDVAVERGIVNRIGLLSNGKSRHQRNERGLWLYDQKSNQMGVGMDMNFVVAAKMIEDKERAKWMPRFTELTGFDKLNTPKLKGWLLYQGVPVENLQKGTIAALLNSDVEDEDDGDPTYGYESLAGEDEVLVLAPQLPSHVREVLEIKQMLGGAAVKKLKRMLACVCYDGRAKGLIQFHAAHTGRAGGRLLQPQNFPRDTIKDLRTGKPLDPDRAVAAILSGDPATVQAELGLPPLEAVARSLRHALVPGPGKVFVVGDYAQIEARVVLALAGQHDKTKLLAEGYPVYFDMAEQIYGKPKGTWATTDEEQLKLNKAKFSPEYTIGKNTILGCGFQMGPNKFHDRYCPDQPLSFADGVIRTYRKDWAPKVPHLWFGLDNASGAAILAHAGLRAYAAGLEGVTEAILKENEGYSPEAYGCKFYMDGDWLVCQLPSGWQKLWYYRPLPVFSRYVHPDGRVLGNLQWSYQGQRSGAPASINMYGGIITENVVQALARGIMCAAIDRLERAGYDVVLTVHDEIVCEVNEKTVDEPEFAAIMAEHTPWTERLQIPIAVETWTGTRYRK